ncbi:MAG: hypothetical protein JWM10_4205 [Myxococcaceae bacterium]|nr:hypothetical protein [Myxococcaceae bacterium]
MFLLAGWWIVPALMSGAAYAAARLLAWRLRQPTQAFPRSTLGRRALPAVAFVAVFAALCPTCDAARGAIDRRLLTHEATGSFFALEPTDLWRESERDFNGDGISAYVYRVPPGTAARLLASGARFWRSPSTGGRDRPWRVVTWRRGRPDEAALRAIREVIPDGYCSSSRPSPFEETNPRRCRGLVDAVNAALARAGTFIAYRYKDPQPWGGYANVDIFIFDPVSNLFIVGNSNT